MSSELETCSRLFAKLEAQRTGTLAELREWPADRVRFRPAPGTWCACEVLDHLVRAETGAIAGVRDGLRNPHILGAEDRPLIAVLDRALRSDQKFKIPLGSEAVYPDPQAMLPDIAERWEQTRDELAVLVRQPGAHDAGRGVFRHPFAGWMTFAEVLNHFHAHLYHHEIQLAHLRAVDAAC